MSDAKPKVPAVLSVRTKGDLAEALEIVLLTGLDKTDATKWAMQWAAHCLKHAWAQGVVPEGKIPDMQANYRRPERRV
ncbi:hypothetical protein ACIBAH_34770 [Streptomyces sp. NPDC051445]|uniref:hypothetical protein n=1 Tax=Streptomyces sp. NPDC051445 TaxID=3365653 RepID=UPI00378EA440